MMVVCCVAYRLYKEKQMYEKEVIDLEAKVEKMKADGKDEYDIKKQVTVNFRTFTLSSCVCTCRVRCFKSQEV